MARVLLDSSIWISFFTTEDINHQQAIQILRSVFSIRNTIIIPDLILCEILNVSFRLKPDVAYYEKLRSKIKKLEPVVKVVTGGREFWLDFAPSEIPNAGLKSSDALVFCYVKYFDVEEFQSFDKQLRKRVAQLAVNII